MAVSAMIVSMGMAVMAVTVPPMIVFMAVYMFMLMGMGFPIMGMFMGVGMCVFMAVLMSMAAAALVGMGVIRSEFMGMCLIMGMMIVTAFFFLVHF